MDASHGIDLPTELQSERRATLDQLMPLVYEQLRSVARRQLASREHGATLSTTGLVHEAYLKMAGHSRIAWEDRAHFFAIASVAMRHVLVDRARARLRLKRDGGTRITLDEEQIPHDELPEVMLELNAAVEELCVVEPRLGRVVECRFFAGLTEDETADALGVTPRTVQRDWAKAKMLLRRTMSAVRL